MKHTSVDVEPTVIAIAESSESGNLRSKSSSVDLSKSDHDNRPLPLGLVGLHSLLQLDQVEAQTSISEIDAVPSTNTDDGSSFDDL